MNITELKKLADEIEKRGLKFADVVEGHYEMLSEDERDAVCQSLREKATLMYLANSIALVLA